MEDFNFFEDYIDSSQMKISKVLIFSILLAFLASVLIFHTLYSSVIIKGQVKAIEILEDFGNNDNKLLRVEKIKEKEKEVKELKDFVGIIKTIDGKIESRDIINEKKLEEITLMMPEELYFTSLEISKGEMEIIGRSKDRLSIAEFEKSLEDLENLEEIFISQISLDENTYKFTININMKGDFPIEDKFIKEVEN